MKYHFIIEFDIFPKTFLLVLIGALVRAKQDFSDGIRYNIA
jgi:hypothetical protein